MCSICFPHADAAAAERPPEASSEATEPAPLAAASEAEEPASGPAAAQPSLGVSTAPAQPVAAAGRPESVEEELRELLGPQSRRSYRSVQDQIYDIVVPKVEQQVEPGPDAPLDYKKLAQAKEAPRLFPGGANKAEEVSPDRIHPYRLFFPGQLYAPQDLDPYSAKSVDFDALTPASKRGPSHFISRAEVEAHADFRNAQFLTSFVSEAGKLVPRRRTRLQQKLHRHLCRQIKVARSMAILPIDSRLPQFQPRRRAPRAPPPPRPTK
ncbi:hypothetical protein N2152v2_010454 [Parachlorella kessleri]